MARSRPRVEHERSSRTHTLRQLLHSVNFVAGALITLLVLATAVVSTFYTPYDPSRQSIPNRMQGPSAEHLLGTDQFGRDVLSRMMQGAQTSILVGIVSVGIGMSFGLVLGVWCGFFGGWLDEFVMRGMDVLFAFPAILNAILFTTIFGVGVINSIVAIGIYTIPVFARLSRSGVLVGKEADYVAAAYAIGRGNLSVAWRHVFPNIVSPLIVQGTVQFAGAILSEAGLSYLGLGTQPPTASWGRMLRDAQTYMAQNPRLAILPGVAIAVAVLGLNLLGDGLRDVLDPRLTRSR
ncbi:MAG: ABC transporter permease [Candidatus Bipolaricaulis sp.]|nr:ABC transporter permease [Candidatus Bipolaricaulis sp.]